ncbi:MAG: hypothetical protein ACRYGG_00555, partial [Janthinobacterium lividum]
MVPVRASDPDGDGLVRVPVLVRVSVWTADVAGVAFAPLAEKAAGADQVSLDLNPEAVADMVIDGPLSADDTSVAVTGLDVLVVLVKV